MTNFDLGFIDGGTRGIQVLLAGGNIAIVNGVANTLDYYIIGNPFR